jgi:uncharacterized protein YrrD
MALKNYSKISGNKLDVIDGELGSVDDILFDDRDFLIRYLVANTIKWLPSRKVLVSPVSIIKIDDDKIKINLTKEKVRSSPELKSDMPVSKQTEKKLVQYFSWTQYWLDINTRKGDPNLRSCQEMIGYSVEGLDGKTGTVKDITFDGWGIKWLVINNIEGEDVCLDIETVQKIIADMKMIKVNETRNTIANAPKNDTNMEGLIKKMQDYYGSSDTQMESE